MSDRWSLFDAAEAEAPSTRAIPAITLWQPWATLISLCVKPDETRSWNLRYRGPMAIHAAQYKGALGMCYRVDAIRRVFKAQKIDPKTLPLGKIVCLADVVDCQVITAELRARTSASAQQFGNYADGRYAWKFGRIVPLDQPLQATGHQGLWRWECPINLLAPFKGNPPSPISSK